MITRCINLENRALGVFFLLEGGGVPGGVDFIFVHSFVTLLASNNSVAKLKGTRNNLPGRFRCMISTGYWIKFLLTSMFIITLPRSPTKSANFKQIISNIKFICWRSLVLREIDFYPGVSVLSYNDDNDVRGSSQLFRLVLERN